MLIHRNQLNINSNLIYFGCIFVFLNLIQSLFEEMEIIDLMVFKASIIDLMVFKANGNGNN